jgi:hypothetical protein
MTIIFNVFVLTLNNLNTDTFKIPYDLNTQKQMNKWRWGLKLNTVLSIYKAGLFDWNWLM